jgi:FKBP-type peptidyl-prolyl cis-trans isomerase
LAQTPPPAAAPKKPATATAPAPALTEDQKALYSLGVLLSRNLDAFSLTPAEFDAVKRGFTDAYLKKADLKEAESMGPKIQAMQHDRARKLGDAYLAKAAAAPGAVKTASGLVYIPVKEGGGASPARTDKVKVAYEGRLVTGTVFDSSAQHGGSASFALTGVIPCWTEALQLMKVGGKARLVCPAPIAYGDRPMGPIPPGSTLDFDVELLDIEAAPHAATATPGVPGTPAVPAVPATPAAPASPAAPAGAPASH